MSLLDSFFSPSQTSLKVCGITSAEAGAMLVEEGVPAVGINFWPKSKRYCAPDLARQFAPSLQGQILRVGVFVNAREQEVLDCYEANLIDVAQFHGDESNEYLSAFSRHSLPFIKAIGVSQPDDLNDLDQFHTPYLLLDAHAPGVYGGTGESIDWHLAASVVQTHPQYSIMLAGGIKPENAAEAASIVSPCALDTASGSESAPGIKDRAKVQLLMNALNLV